MKKKLDGKRKKIDGETYIHQHSSYKKDNLKTFGDQYKTLFGYKYRIIKEKDSTGRSIYRLYLR